MSHASMAWVAQAVCAQVSPDLWFPEVGEPTGPAKRICWESCNVRAECLDYALRNDLQEGVYGGLSANQRRSLRRSGAAA